MTESLSQRICRSLQAEIHPAVAAYAGMLAEEAGADAVLFYGSNLRTGSLEGVLDFYVLLPGPQRDRIWPLVSYREWEFEGRTLRAKIATMSLRQFLKAAAGQSRDTTIWARFVQPSALAWARDDTARGEIADAIAEAAKTAARLAAVLGPERGSPDEFWGALFRATYEAEFRVEKAGRGNSIVAVNREHFDGLLGAAWHADGIAFERDGNTRAPRMDAARRRKVQRWWSRVRRLGKPINLLRIAKAATTFDGAAEYAAWKVERHTGVQMEVTEFRRKHPLLAAPGALFEVMRVKSRTHS